MSKIAAFSEPTQLGNPDLLRGAPEVFIELLAGEVDVFFYASLSLRKGIGVKGETGEARTAGIDIGCFFQEVTNIHRGEVGPLFIGSGRKQIAKIDSGAATTSFTLGVL